MSLQRDADASLQVQGLPFPDDPLLAVRRQGKKQPNQQASHERQLVTRKLLRSHLQQPSSITFIHTGTGAAGLAAGPLPILLPEANHSNDCAKQANTLHIADLKGFSS
jgi:hypothetical protein